VVDDENDWRIAVNVQSKEHPSAVEFLVDDDFDHPMLDELPPLTSGFRRLPAEPGGLALDYIRANLFDRQRMRPLPPDVTGPDNDLNEKIGQWVERAVADPDAEVYAFGERWGPEARKDRIFGIQPSNGIHDIHMNQGNVERFIGDDGVWQDGALILRFPGENRWVGMFLKFQSQSWHTDDRTGHRLETTGRPGGVVPPRRRIDPAEVDLTVRIVAALVNPVGPAPERETVTLLNTTAAAINLGGWSIANRDKDRFPLDGEIEPGRTITFTMSREVPLSNQGGMITLLDARGLKVHGVAYTAAQAQVEGTTITF
jgi:uncharacterized protein YukJ